ncbi:MAG: acyl carrier protein [Alphaproteobacteria bacterium TMED89]|nr:hypothetical protein [Rhodospirillaceae bacterium]RPH19044.1 MAG: acyl carrier protein [Alphaproteobacteria bacterium TMED89]
MDIQEANQIALELLGKYLERDVTEADLLQSFDELGIDSLEMLSMSFEIEKRFNVKIEVEHFMSEDNLRDGILAVLAQMET